MKEGKKQLTFIDLFAGAGGLSEGFIRSGYKPIAFVEADLNACYTLTTRLAYYHLKENKSFNTYVDYLKGEIDREQLYNSIPDELSESVINEKISDGNLISIFSRIDSLLRKSDNKNVDVLIGGPPCQAYSLIGRKRNKDKKETDERIHYYKLYAKFLKKYKPKIFVFENVQGLLSYDEGELFPLIKEVLSKSGYTVEYKLLNAADFGVLQNRKRVIIIGWLKGLDFNYPAFEKVKHEFVVNDLLKDLPSLKPSRGKRFTEYKTEITDYLKKFEIRDGFNFVTQHVTRSNNENDIEIYKTAIRLWNEKKQRLKYPDLKPELITHKNTKDHLDRFKVVAKELPACHTLVAHISKDGHSFIYPSLKQVRSLSVREAARIQSYPDDYFFEGSRTSAFVQIGNAVPPLMAEQIAQKLRELICPKN
jgi:DNA (cytosine-5)-methyltransferase 1